MSWLSLATNLKLKSHQNLRSMLQDIVLVTGGNNKADLNFPSSSDFHLEKPQGLKGYNNFAVCFLKTALSGTSSGCKAVDKLLNKYFVRSAGQ